MAVNAMYAYRKLHRVCLLFIRIGNVAAKIMNVIPFIILKVKPTFR